MSTLPDALLPLLADRVESTGDHLLWTGPMDSTSPMVKTNGHRYRVRRLILAQVLGRTLVGEATASCAERRCVAPRHLLDEVGRRNTAALDLVLADLDQAMPALPNADSDMWRAA